MKPNHCANLLTCYQDWRRFDGEIGAGPEMLHPQLIGEAIDAAIDIANQFEDILDMLCLALPYVESAAADPGYKRDHVAALAKRMEAAIRSLGQFGEGGAGAELGNETAAPAIVFFPCGSLGEAVEEGTA